MKIVYEGLTGTRHEGYSKLDKNKPKKTFYQYRIEIEGEDQAELHSLIQDFKRQVELESGGAETNGVRADIRNKTYAAKDVKISIAGVNLSGFDNVEGRFRGRR